METIDTEMAQRVWQRVTNTVPPPAASPDLQMLIEEELADAAIYLHLSRLFDSRHSRILRQMHQQEQAHAACLKGIYRMMTGHRPIPRIPKPEREKPILTLRRCYERELRCLSQYEARSADPQYGQAFARMARQEQEHCRILLELLGRLEK